MICEVIESSNHLCMLHATVKYLADLPEQTSNVARRELSNIEDDLDTLQRTGHFSSK